MTFPNRCQKCVYRARESSEFSCNYLEITGHPRIAVSPQPGEKCTAFAPNDEREKRTSDLFKLPTKAPHHRTRSPAYIEKKEALRAQMMQLYTAGLSDPEIGAQVGLSKSAVFQWRKSVALPPNPNAARQRHNDEILQLYRQGMTDAQIGELVGRSGRTIANWRQKHHLPINPPKEESQHA